MYANIRCCRSLGTVAASGGRPSGIAAGYIVAPDGHCVCRGGGGGVLPSATEARRGAPWRGYATAAAAAAAGEADGGDARCDVALRGVAMTARACCGDGRTGAEGGRVLGNMLQRRMSTVAGGLSPASRRGPGYVKTVRLPSGSSISARNSVRITPGGGAVLSSGTTSHRFRIVPLGQMPTSNSLAIDDGPCLYVLVWRNSMSKTKGKKSGRLGAWRDCVR